MNQNSICARLCVCVLISAASLTAQTLTAQNSSGPNSSAAPDSEPTLIAQQQPAQPPAPPAPTEEEQEQTQPPPQPPKPAPPPPPKYKPSGIDNGGGFSIEPFYWFGATKPIMRGGATDPNTDSGNIDYPGAKLPVYGGIVSVPAGGSSTIRFTYFRADRSDGVVAAQNLAFFQQTATAGSPIAIAYRIEDYKLSYDYLTYFWGSATSEFRLKTLWEVQYVSMTNSFAIFTQNTDGSYTVNSAEGDKSIIFPTLGLGLENTLGRHFRWEVKASGFAWRHRATLGDIEADLAYRVGRVELVAGGKYFHFKTSPQRDEYFKANLYGPYVGIRFYWKKR